MIFTTLPSGTITITDYCFLTHKEQDYGFLYQEPQEENYYMFRATYTHFTNRQLRTIQEKLTELNSTKPGN